MDLPQPLSPTTPSTSPRRIVKLTPSTARTVPSSRGKDTRKSLISKSMLLSTSRCLLTGVRIGCIAHAVANKTEGHHRNDHECYRCEQPWIQRNSLHVLSILQQGSP